MGTYEADLDTPDAARAIASGMFKFRLDGEKLHGAFVLVRTAGFGRHRQPASGDLRQKWLLIHRHDADAVEGWDTEAAPHSVKSGLTNDELAARHGSRRAWRALEGWQPWSLTFRPTWRRGPGHVLYRAARRVV